MTFPDMLHLIRYWTHYGDNGGPTERHMIRAIVRETACRQALEQRVAELEALPVITWIPVSERLPDPELRVLAAYSDGRMTTTLRALHIPRFAVQCDYNPDMELDYDLYTDLAYYPRGWYEAIDNGEYAFVGPLIGTVTHWAKLPALPRVEVKP